MKKRIFWLAGEKSGDLHAAKVIHYISQKHPDWEHFGVGGKQMQAEGFNSMFPFERFNVMGFLEVAKHLKFFMNVHREIEQILRKEKPDAVVLVDYPGLNMRIAKLAKSLDIKVLYYICPQFWAWKKHRIYQLRDHTDAIGYILPFEGEHFAEAKINATYTGHPISEEFYVTLSKTDLANRLNIDENKKWVSFFPGSRNAEIAKLLPVYLQVIKKLNRPDIQFLLSRTDTVSDSLYDKLMKSCEIDVRIVEGYNYEMMQYSDFLCVKSGTTSLETAYAGTPFIICYKTSWFSYLLGRLLVKINWIGLPNIIMQQSVVPELIQHQANVDNIAAHITRYLDNENQANDKMKEQLANLHELLVKKCASHTVTTLLEELVL